MTTATQRRTAAVTAMTLAAFSGAAVVGAVSSASAAPTLHTSLSIRAHHTVINPGGATVISGDLQARGGHAKLRRIVLMDRPVGTTAWTKDKGNLTRAHGAVRFVVSPSVNTAYQLVFAGNKKQHGSHSGVVAVRVADTTSLVASVGTPSVPRGTTDTVGGVLSLDGQPLVGDTVTLSGKNRKHKLAKLGSQTTGTDGSVTFTVNPSVTTHYVLRFKKTEANRGAVSAPVTVHVPVASSLSIRARYAKKQKVEAISGDLRALGHNLRHRAITLQSRPSGSSTWTTVTTAKTDRHGVVVFKETAPTASTDYQLLYAGGLRVEGCQSGVVTVTVS